MPGSKRDLKHLMLNLISSLIWTILSSSLCTQDSKRSLSLKNAKEPSILLPTFQVKSTGQTKLLTLLGTKECADHAGLSPLLELLKDSQLFPLVKQTFSLLNNLSIVLEANTKMKAAMEEIWILL